MLQARDLSKRYGIRAVFNRLNFEVERGDVVAVVGSNGSGKSTLLRIVAGLLRATKGELVWDAEVANAPWRCGLFAPDSPVYHELTVQENLEFFASPRMPAVNVSRENLYTSHLEQFHLSSRRHEIAGELSSGWRARLQLAVAAWGAPPMLLLDEPAAHLDTAGLDLLQNLITTQRENGVALIATNDPREVARCDYCIEL